MPKKSYIYWPRMFPRMFTNLKTGKRWGVWYERYENARHMGEYKRKDLDLRRKN